MQFSIVALLSIVALAYAAPAPLAAKEIVARQTPLPTESSVMSDANGNVVAFNSAGVHQPATLAGQ